jgi:hypothetical protein
MNRLGAMNSALANYSTTVAGRSKEPSKFVPFQNLPGNSADASDKSVCWQTLPAKTTAVPHKVTATGSP